jgi:hypothetical protein
MPVQAKKNKSFRVGNFTVNTFADQGFIDWDWLNSQSSIREMTFATCPGVSGNDDGENQRPHK